MNTSCLNYALLIIGLHIGNLSKLAMDREQRQSISDKIWIKISHTWWYE